MQIDDDRKRLRKFIIEETEIAQAFARRIATEKLQAARKLAGISAPPPSQEEIQKYIFDNHDDVEKRVDGVVDDLCRKILPEERLRDLLFQFGILSLFLVPPFMALVAVAIRDFHNNALAEAASEAGGAVLVATLLLASAIAVFRKERRQK